MCVADLEDELIRSLGVSRVEQLIEVQGELGPFRTFTRQPAQRNRPRAQQLRRFLGTRSGRKIHYGHVLGGALDVAAAHRDQLMTVKQCAQMFGVSRTTIVKFLAAEGVALRRPGDGVDDQA